MTGRKKNQIFGKNGIVPPCEDGSNHGQSSTSQIRHYVIVFGGSLPNLVGKLKNALCKNFNG